jgi:hypothetical protein
MENINTFLNTSSKDNTLLNVVDSSNPLGLITKASVHTTTNYKILLGITIERKNQFKRFWYEVLDEENEKLKFFIVYFIRNVNCSLLYKLNGMNC